MRKGKIALISGGVVGALLLVGATVLLVRGIQDFRRSVTELSRQKQALARFYKLNPFPSEVNVRLERTNVALLEKKFDELMETLRAGNVASGKVSGPQFSRAVGLVRTHLTAQAGKRRPESSKVVLLPPGFAFGFSHYAETGLLPKPVQAQRLSTQLLMTKRLVELLYEAEVDALVEIKRDLFDNPGSTSAVAAPEPPPAALPGLPRPARPSRRRPQRPVETLYEKERFELTFRTTEKGLIKVLNGLSASPMFCVVERVTIAKQIKGLATPGSRVAPTGGAGPAALPGAEGGLSGLLSGFPAAATTTGDPGFEAPAPAPSAVQVCGVEIESPMTVTAVLDVYNFVGEEPGDTNE